MRARKEILYLWMVMMMRPQSQFYSLVDPSFIIAIKINAHFGMALRANLVSHFRMRTSVLGAKHDRKAYMLRPNV
jgi:hypothetical protein